MTQRQDLPELVLGPMLRFVDVDPDTGAGTATVWVQAGSPCTVGVHAEGVPTATARTFALHGHHFALVDVAGLDRGAATPYTVTLDGEAVWPPPDSEFGASVIRIPGPGEAIRLVFGSCRNSVPHDAEHNARFGPDVLRAYAHRLAAGGSRPAADDDTAEDDAAEDVAAENGAVGSGEAAVWPTLLLMLGDQVYADETSPAIAEFIAARRDLSVPPGRELANFVEYAEVYRLAWSDPANRWLLSCVSSAMIFDDHDIRDDWNTSATWRGQMAALPWWRDRIVGGLAAYWVYQHLGNMSPAERAADPLLAAVRACEGDAGGLVDDFAARADEDPTSVRWSYARRLGGVALIVLDCRAGRVLEAGARAMLDPAELAWFDVQARGDVDHLLVATSVPFLLPPGLHDLEGWNEAICAGAWGRLGAAAGERIRQGGDLEHWGAFRASFAAVSRSVAEVALGRRGRSPATVAFLSGDVHNSYLARVSPPRAGAASPVYQLVCSPVRNQLPRLMRYANRAACSRPAAVLGAALARAAGVRRRGFRWHIEGEQSFVNSLATLELAGPGAVVRWETTIDPGGDPDGGDAVPALAELASSRLA